MTPTPKRAPRTRDLQLSLAALFAFGSWLGLLGFFAAIPTLFLMKIPLTWPVVLGSASLVVILFLLYYLLSGTLRCQVCGGPVFGGGEGHRKHPHAKKLFGLSYSRRVAAEILTKSGFHCMHCQTFCRSRRRSQPLPEAAENPPAAPQHAPLFPNARPLVAAPPASAAEGLFANIFTPTSAPVPPPPTSQPPPQPIAPPSQVAPSERPPWLPDLTISPFTKTDAMNTMPAPPLSPRTISQAIPPILPQALPAQEASPFSLVPAMPEARPVWGAPFVNISPAPVEETTAAPEIAEVVEALPVEPETKATAPDLKQVVAEVAQLIEQTRLSLDQLFSGMVSQLKETLAPSVTAPVPQTPALAATPPPAPPAPVVEMAPVVLEAPAPPQPTPPAVDPAKAAALNEILSRAFAKRQEPPAPPAPAPVIPAPVFVERPMIPVPQTPFQFVPLPAPPIPTIPAPVVSPFPSVQPHPAPTNHAFSGVPPLPPPWDTEADLDHTPAPFTFLSKKVDEAPAPSAPAPDWNVPPLTPTPVLPPPLAWPVPHGKA